MIDILGIVLFNIISFFSGIFTGIGVYHKCRQKDLNYNNPRVISTTYPFSPQIDSSSSASAPPPFNLNSSPVLASQPKQTEIIIKNND
tara:strand:- start:923 stop:1186 length:264 start_codon:yes stop_codon:yes gene_type:complete